MLGPWLCDAVIFSHVGRRKLQDEDCVQLCAMEASGAEPRPLALGLPTAPPSHLPKTGLGLLPGLAPPLLPQPPALSILRPWPPVSRGFFLSWWSWPVMAMKCYLLALGSSSLKEGMGPVWLIGSNIMKSIKM